MATASPPTAAPDFRALTIGEVFDIPLEVHQGDFVIKLTEGASAERAAETLRNYVVTPQLAECFDEALDMIRGAVSTRTSRAAYLHGSFGSGKSHFMSVLALLLDRHPGARAVAELAPVVAEHNAWLTDRKILVVPLHLLNARSLESAIFGQYARFVGQRHPDAPTPGFYRSELLFENARGIRANMGDAAFFAALNAKATGDSEWGTLGAGWDADAFEAAMALQPEDPERARLVGALIDAFFQQVAGLAGSADESYIEIDRGLVVLTEHAKGLGYDSVVLFLDEVMLWLASRAADSEFLSTEAQKLVALVETADMTRSIPIVSFLARQRDLRELVGEHLAGAEQQAIGDVLQYWEGRFSTITLEDRNLPAIIEKRLLRPQNDTMRQRLEEAYAATEAIRSEVLSILLTRNGDRAQFRRVYPFSPVLVQALVALSSVLQRERTALKLLVQLQVKQRDRLHLGDVMPVGDLWDVLFEGSEQPFGAVARQRFDQARRLWRNRLLPLLEEEKEAAIAQGAAADVAQRAFENDRRLLATLLLGALAEGVEALTGLTPQKLAALNHGTVRTRIPGQEARTVLDKVRRWAARVGEIRIDEAVNPALISVHLVGVDTEAIIRNAQAADNLGARKQRVRAILFEMAGIAAGDALMLPLRPVPWRGTQRQVEVLYSNVRELAPEQFQRSGEAEWRVVFDYPFDEPGHRPADDRATVQAAQHDGLDAQTIVWLPSFLTVAAQDELGKLVIIEHLLSGTQLDAHAAHLSANDRVQARQLLENQRTALRTNLQNGLLAAYGITEQFRDRLDEGCLLDQHLYTFATGLVLERPVGATLREALDHTVGQALAFTFPGHPEFTGEVKLAALRRVWHWVQQASQQPNGRVEVDRGDRDEMRRFAVPLGLGQMGDAHFVLERHWVTHFAQCEARSEGGTLTVARVRRWIDEPRRRGLPLEAANLVILTWALQTNRTFHLYGSAQPVGVTLDRLDDQMEVKEQRLPDEATWTLAVQRAAELFGVSVPLLRSAQAMDILARRVGEEAAGCLAGTRAYCEQLDVALSRAEVPLLESTRRATAVAARDLASALQGQTPDKTVGVLATAAIPTTATAVGEVIKQGAQLAAAVSRGPWALLPSLRQLPAGLFGARTSRLFERLRETLVLDEHAVPIAPVLQEVEREGMQLITELARLVPVEPAPPPVVVPPPPPTPDAVSPTSEPKRERKERRAPTSAMKSVLAELEADATHAPPGSTIEVTWTIVDIA